MEHRALHAANRRRGPPARAGISSAGARDHHGQSRILAAAARLVVDFWSPGFSPRGRALLRRVPGAIALGDGGGFAEGFVPAVQDAAAAVPVESPEAEFLANWRLGATEWKKAFETRLREF